MTRKTHIIDGGDQGFSLCAQKRFTRAEDWPVSSLLPSWDRKNEAFYWHLGSFR